MPPLDPQAPQPPKAEGPARAAGSQARPGRFRRAIAGVGVAVGLSVVFVGAFIGSTLVHLHMNLPPTRRFARAITQQNIGKLLTSDLEVGEIDRLDLCGLDVRSLAVIDAREKKDAAGKKDAREEQAAPDPQRKRILLAEGVHAKLFSGADTFGACTGELVGMGIRALASSKPLDVAIEEVRIDSADVLLAPGEGGGPSIGELFVLRVPPKESPPGGGDFSVQRAEIGRIHLHGDYPWPDLEADLGKLEGWVLTTPGVVAVELASVPLAVRSVPTPKPAPVDAHLDFHMFLDPTKGSMRVWSDVTVKVGDVDAKVHGLFATDVHKPSGRVDAHVTATVDVPRLTPAALATIMPNSPLGKPVSVSVAADGDLPTIAIGTRVSDEDGGEVVVEGRLEAGERLLVDGDLSVRDLDPRIMRDVREAKPANAGARVRLRLEPGGVLDLSGDLHTEPALIDGIAIPATDVHVTKAGDSLVGRVTAHEEGAPVDVAFALVPDEGVRFDVAGEVPALSAVRRFPMPKGLTARVERVGVVGTLRPAADKRGDGIADILDRFLRGTLDARVTGAFSGVKAPGEVAIDSGAIDARVRGTLTLDALAIENGAVTGRRPRAAGYEFDSFNVKVNGPLKTMRVETLFDAGDGESIRASGNLDLASGGMRGVKVHVKRSAGEVEGEIGRVTAGPAGIAIDGLALRGDGVGKLSGGLVVRGKELVGKLHAEGVDLGRVGAIAKVRLPMKGIADIDVDLAPAARGRKGHIQVHLEDGEVPLANVNGISAMVNVTFDGERIKTDGLVRLIARAGPNEPVDDRCDGTIIRGHSTGEGVLGGGFLDPATWMNATGKVDIAADDWNLRCIARLVPPGVLPFDVRGRLTMRTSIERAPGARVPAIREALVRTRGFELTGSGGPGAPPPVWETRNVDVQVKAKIDPQTGHAEGEVALFDQTMMASVGVATKLDLLHLVAHPDAAWDAIRKAPLSGKISVPRRAFAAFSSLPQAVAKALPPILGDVQLDGYLDGTIERPFAALRFRGFKVAQGTAPGDFGAAPLGIPVDLDAIAIYDGEHASFDARVAHEDKQIVRLDAGLALAVRDLLEGKPPRWTGGVHAVLDDVPLGAIPALGEHELAGHLRGTVAIAGLHEKPSIDVDLQVPDLRVGGDPAVEPSTFKLSVVPTQGDRAAATAKIQIASKQGGRVDASAKLGVIWTDGVAPAPDGEKPAELHLAANRFRMSALQPFLAGVVSKLDGHLDGSADVVLARLADDERANVKVRLKLADGVVNLPQLGQEFHGVGLSINSGLAGYVGIEDITAEGTRGRITGAGKLRLAGRLLRRAEVKLKILQGEEIPVTLEGVPLGNAYGEVAVVADQEGRDLSVTVRVPSLRLTLPATTSRSTQALEDNPDIVLSHRRAPEPKKEPAGPKKPRGKLTLRIELGDIGLDGNVPVGAGLKFDMKLTDIRLRSAKGAPIKIAVGETTSVTGDIELTNGSVELLKRKFVIDPSSTIHLSPEEPANPYLNVKARWEAPTGDEVFIEYVGKLSEQKIDFRSASLSKPEIYSLLLTGTKDSGASQGQQFQGQGKDLVGQAFASALNTQLSSSISTNFSTNEDGSLRPGLTYSSGNKTIELSTYEGTGSGDTAASKGTHTSVTIDWRFWKNWSVRGLVDIGAGQTKSGLDLLWLYRY